MLSFYNTLTQKKEKFIPINPNNIGIYSCGPTVYDFAHIGNLRAYIFVDILNRVLRVNNFQTKLVMNITDVDDKTINKSVGDKSKFFEIIKLYEEKFWHNLDELNIIRPNVVTKATLYINKMIVFIEDLVKRWEFFKDILTLEKGEEQEEAEKNKIDKVQNLIKSNQIDAAIKTAQG